MQKIMPQTYVLFGATGDLAQRKIIPALFSLFQKGALPSDFSIIAFSRRPWSDEAYRVFIRPSIEKAVQKNSTETEIVARFLECIRYVSGTFDDMAAFEALQTLLAKTDATFHLAIQPEFYTRVIENLDAAGLRGNLLVEKPFGESGASASALEARIEKHRSPETIYRIDHYLGKAGLRALIDLRRSDIEFESALDAEQVASIEVRMVESIGIEGRGEFYDAVGAVRDVVQNHVLSMLASALADLEAAVLSESGARASVLRALEIPNAIVRGQYEGYRDENGVLADSDTETYSAFVTSCTLPRWRGMPIRIVAGKALHEKHSDIRINFKNGVSKAFDIESPKLPDAYETIIAAALRHDKDFFQSFEEVAAAWEFTDVLRSRLVQTPMTRYEKGDTPEGSAASDN